MKIPSQRPKMLGILKLVERCSQLEARCKFSLRNCFRTFDSTYFVRGNRVFCFSIRQNGTLKIIGFLSISKMFSQLSILVINTCAIWTIWTNRSATLGRRAGRHQNTDHLIMSCRVSREKIMSFCRFMFCGLASEAE